MRGRGLLLKFNVGEVVGYGKDTTATIIAIQHYENTHHSTTSYLTDKHVWVPEEVLDEIPA